MSSQYKVAWRGWLLMLDELDVGGSVFIPEPRNVNHHGSLRQTISLWAKRNNKVLACRSRTEGGSAGMKVWRLE